MITDLEKYEYVLQKYEQQKAVIYLDETEKMFKHLTYKDVKEIKETCCEKLSQLVKEAHSCFALFMPHNPYIPSVVMSLQTLGHCFIFLDENASPERQLELLKRLNVKWMISLAEHGDHKCLTDNFCIVSRLVPDLLLSRCKLKFETSVGLENISYIICTSGTTGHNKTVRVQNNCIYCNVECLKDVFKITSEDIIYFGTALTFDPSMVELFLALLTGATLLILPRKIHSNPKQLFVHLFLKEHGGVNFLQMPPSVFLRFSQQEVAHILRKSSLRILCLGGEEFPVSMLHLPRKEDLRVFNLYGITEVSSWASVYEVGRQDDVVYLGNALAETEMEVRDESGFPIEEGIGEMFIGSSSRICFVDDESPMSGDKTIFRSTGDLVEINNKKYRYIGRKDDTIKRYGTRVVLSEIEDTVFKETQLFNKCIWCEAESKLLLFFVISDFDFAQRERIADKLRVKLLHCLSKECYPDYVDVLKAIPLTHNGKLDKKALHKLYLSTRQRKPTANASQIFNELLLRYFGASQSDDATFSELGCNSIVLLQFYEEFKSHFNDSWMPDGFLAVLFEQSIGACKKFICSLNTQGASKRKRSELITEPNCAVRRTDDLSFKIIWKYDMKACVDCSPVAICRSDERHFVAVGSFAPIFAVVHATSASKIAEIVLPETIEAACCVSSCKQFAFVGCFDYALYCIKINDCSVVWRFATEDRVKCTPVFCKKGTAVVFGSYDKCVYCLNSTDGVLIWKSKLEGIVNTNPIATEEGIFIATITGNCFCLNEADGNILWKYQSGYTILGSPCLVSFEINKNYVCWPNVNGTINCFTCQDGNLLWTYKASNQVFCPLVHHDGLIIFGCHDQFLHCLEMQGDSVSLKFKTFLDAAISSASCVYKQNYLVTATTAGSVYLINLADGVIRAQIRLAGQIFSSPCVCDDRIYLGCRDNNLHCLAVLEKIKDSQ